jgi:Domain of Unknown Function (DUF1080)/GMC oxidoreductase
MATKLGIEKTHFTLDILGRYTCNTDAEANAAMERADARPFDVVVVGGGSFGPILAENVFFDDETRSRRVLVVDAGPFVLPEHQQNLPVLGDVESLVKEVPWQADQTLDFAGLRVMLGGRSVFFGGWSPQLLDNVKHTEMPRTKWPEAVVEELKATYFPQAARLLAVDETNDFIFGELHEVLRQRLAAGIDSKKVDDAIPLDDLELHLKIGPATPVATRRLLKLEAPLAVQSRAPRPGYFPVNKFSAVPLIIRCAREAQFEVERLLDDRAELGENPDREGDDVKKRFMIVPNFRVTRLEATPAANGPIRVTKIIGRRREAGGEVDAAIPIKDDANVVIALGTIESARLVLNSFPDLPGRDRVGRNLMAHLRSNVVLRIPRSSLPANMPQELQASALLLKGAHRFQVDGQLGYFHLQITAAGLNTLDQDDHVELFMKVPDIDFFEDIIEADDQHVVITIRGIGEMQPDNPLSRVVAVPGSTQVRAEVVPNAKDEELWTAMDRASDQVAKVFAAGKDFEIRLPNGKWKNVAPTANLETELPLTFKDQGKFAGETGPRGRRDRLGTTHHEAGTLRLGANPADSVTDDKGKLRSTENVFVAGPMLFPTIGSPNPMLTGTALARRVATHLISTMPHHTTAVTPGFTSLFNGMTLGDWKMSTIRDEPGASNPGRFIVVDGALEATPGTGLGLLWYTKPMPANYVLKLQWKRFKHEANSGVLLRFPDPQTKDYRNTAYVADHFGYEVQIDELGLPNGLDKHRTGAIYGVDAQTLSLQPAKAPGEWNDYEIRVDGDRFTVKLNGAQVTDFVNTDPNRGQPTRAGAPSFIGLQIHFASRMAFRNIEFKEI